MHALIFMAVAAGALAQNAHVRVDIFYSRWKPDTQSQVDRLGHLLLLLPFAIFLIWSSWGYVSESWRMGEKSMESGGLPLVYLLKSVIPLLGVQLVLQAIALIISPASAETTEPRH